MWVHKKKKQQRTVHMCTHHPAAEHICDLSRSGSVDLVYILLRLLRLFLHGGLENLESFAKMSTFERGGAHERRTSSSFSTYFFSASSFEVPFRSFQASLLGTSGNVTGQSQ